MTCDTLHPSVRVAETRYPSSRLIFGFRANGEFPLLLFSSSLRLNTRRLSPLSSLRYTHIDYRLMLPQKVMDLYDSDRAEGGWKPPIVDNRRREQNQKQVTF